MFPGVNLMFNNDIHLMVTIFQQALQFKDHEEWGHAKYVKRHETKIKDAGLLFDYLGLAEQNAKSPLGWKPTRLLMEIIGKRASNPKTSRVPDKDDLTIEFLLHLAFGEDTEPRGHFAFDVLTALGLMRSNDDEGCWEATSQLKVLLKEDQD